jgi:GNAT superfamily N-acetyltransferase
MRIELRPVVQEDMIYCASIINDWIDETPWMPREKSRREIEDIYGEALANGREGYVAECGEIQGYTLFQRKEQFLRVLYVKRGWRKRGIGQLLLDAVKRELPEGFELTCYQPNTSAQDFYRRNGFVEVGMEPLEHPESVPELIFRWTPHG